METLELRIGGMTCGSCVKAVHRALSAVPGVESVDVQLATRTATVRGEGIETNVRALLAAVAAAGYQAHADTAEAATVEGAPSTRTGCGPRAGGCCCG